MSHVSRLTSHLSPLTSHISNLRPMTYPEFIPTANRQLLLNTSSAVRLINHQQIIFIEAEDNYSKIYLDDHTEFRLSKTLGLVEEEINNEMFFRCHRTFLVNVFFIKEISKGDYMCITLKNGSKIPLAKRRLGDLRKLIGEKSRPALYSE
jgi:two-component system LytT family response regulator